MYIREDKAAKYGDAGGKGDQPPHFNAGVQKKGDKEVPKLNKQHHEFE